MFHFLLETHASIKEHFQKLLDYVTEKNAELVKETEQGFSFVEDKFAYFEQRIAALEGKPEIRPSSFVPKGADLPWNGRLLTSEERPVEGRPAALEGI